MVHFAVDDAHVKFCTKLDGEQQDFSEVPKWKQMVYDGRVWVLERKQLDCSAKRFFNILQRTQRFCIRCLKS